MASKETVIRVFAASPGDLAEERAILEQVIRELNLTWSKTIRLRLDLVKWETDAYPGMGEDPQAVINEQIADDYDIFVGIMWSRFGSPTGRAGSGTAEEFNRAYSRYKKDPNQIRIMFYFNDTPVALSQLDPAQLAAVQNFKSELGQRGELYWTYTGRQEFEQLLRIHLSRQAQAWGKLWGVESPTNRSEINQISLPDVNTKVAALEFEEEGFLDLLETGQEKFEIVNSGTARMSAALQKMTAKVVEATDEMNRVRSEGSFDIKQAKRISNRVAEEMNLYAQLMEMEVPNFANAFSVGIDAYSRALTIQNVMGAVERQEEVERAKSAILQFKTVVASNQSTNAAFRQSIADLPRATSALNRAKKRGVAILDRMQEELSTALNLIIEIERVIDQTRRPNN